MSRFPTGPTGRVEVDEVDAGGEDGAARGRLVLERTFRAPIADVWASLTEPERFARWYGPMEGEPGPGRTITVTMAPEDEIVALPVTIIECDPPISFVVDLGDPARPWRISVVLGEADGITTMTFVQTLSDEVDTTEVGPGWEFYADRMTAALEGGEMPDWDGDSYQDTLGPHYS